MGIKEEYEGVLEIGEGYGGQKRSKRCHWRRRSKGHFLRVLAPILGFGPLSLINPRKKERKKDRVVRGILVI